MNERDDRGDTAPEAAARGWRPADRPEAANDGRRDGEPGAGVKAEAGVEPPAEGQGEASAQGDAAAAAPPSESWTEAQVRELKDQSLRLMADIENLRKRHARELDEARKFAASAFARDLLDPIDNFARALAAVPADARGRDPALDSLMTGVEMTERSILAAFERHRLQRIVPERGDRFDPNRHQAMFEVPTAELPAGHVAEIMQPGYVLADRLLRPAMVGVAKAPPQAPAPAGDERAEMPGSRIDTSA
ncbi:MAG: nucleotide exchange factor GrpE [Geminicoccaceae bacterium]|nr:nucleotide exchange factor GrpE [Geminicoccaceae bacterium]